MHDPVRALPARGPAVVVHERLLVPHRPAAAADEAVLPRGLPVAVARGAAGARAVGVLAVHPAEEEPLPVPRLQRRPLCSAAPVRPPEGLHQAMRSIGGGVGGGGRVPGRWEGWDL